jgi:4-hydroxy-3-polyprenylbenzoate decarboxylase
MAYHDLREWISTLEKEGELARITCEVDWNREIGAVAREVLNRKKGPALLFENVTGYSNTWCRKTFVNSMAARERVALAVGLPKDTPYRDITRTIKERLEKPGTINVVDTGPVKENILLGDDIDLYQIPVPHWHAKDGGRYINTACAVVTRSARTGLLNAGTYRGQIYDKNRIGTILAQTQHWGHHYKSHKDVGNTMPVAVVLGWDPTLEILAGAPLLHPGLSEYEYVSSLRQQTCDLVKCKTNDLLVPATAEIVIEGYISSDPGTFVEEGPFGEYTGYMGGEKGKRPCIQVTAITHRNNPIFRGALEGCQPHTWSESAYYAVPGFSAVT